LTHLALTQPRFDDEAVERLRRNALATLRHNAANPSTVASRLLYRTLFANHPYGRDGEGTPESLPRITVAGMKSFLAQRLTREKLIITVCGDLTPEELAPILDQLFADLPATPASPLPHLPEVPLAEAGTVVHIPRPIPQSILLFAQPGLKREDPEWYTLQVLNHIVGGGSLTSRLNEEIREKRGLTYGVSSQIAAYDHAGLILGSASTSNAKAGEAFDLIRTEWRRAATEGVTAAELEDALTYLKGSFALQFTSTRAIADILLQLRRYELGIDYLDRRAALFDAVTLERVNALARQLLDPDRLVTVVTGQPEGIPITRKIENP
jgi:zinc protease